jgi:ubiquinone/menaquinone biosynthesis C-methylase UbiE
VKNDLQSPTTVFGNYSNKYESKNPIARRMVNNFIEKLNHQMKSLPQETIQEVCEVGCGEGTILQNIAACFPQADLYAMDLSAEELEKAKKVMIDKRVDFTVQDATHMVKYQDNEFDLVVCSEVLEHLPDPVAGLHELTRISRRFILISVPQEPVWRILNVCRGKYLRDFGNTPGHLNHWSPRSFTTFLEEQSVYSIQNRVFPFPWQMYLLQKDCSD